MQSVLVVLSVCAAAGVGAIGFGLVGITGFITGAILCLGAWLVWAATIVTLGTRALAEPQTRSDLPRCCACSDFAAAPGVFLALAAMPAGAPIVLVVVAAWMIAAAVIAVRQALDYLSTARAAAVCVIGAALAGGVMERRRPDLHAEGQLIARSRIEPCDTHGPLSQLPFIADRRFCLRRHRAAEGAEPRPPCRRSRSTRPPHAAAAASGSTT